MSGRAIVGGAEYFNGFQGAAYVFVEPQTGWTKMTQTARLTPSDGKQGFMGDSVSISGDTVVAGALPLNISSFFATFNRCSPFASFWARALHFPLSPRLRPNRQLQNLFRSRLL